MHNKMETIKSVQSMLQLKYYKCQGINSGLYLASRNPVSAKYRVLGIGVADSVRTSTVVLNEAIFSFCFTPNLCKKNLYTDVRVFAYV